MSDIKQKALKFLDCEINETNIRDCLAFMMEHQISIKSPDGTIDICGTGGTVINALNVSTTVAIVVAACGYPVAKHCGGAVTSKCGSTDVLRKLGVNMDITPEQAEKQLEDLGLVFLNARTFNPVFDMIAEERKAKGFSIYNVMGAMLTPANVDYKFIEVKPDLEGIERAKCSGIYGTPVIFFTEYQTEKLKRLETSSDMLGDEEDYITNLLQDNDMNCSYLESDFYSFVFLDACVILSMITELNAREIKSKVFYAINSGEAGVLLDKVIDYEHR